MTREEAIELLRSWDGVYIGYSSDEVEEALNMAIQALSSWEKYSDKLWKEAYERGKTEALSQEPCDDLISRDMALEKMADYVASGYADSAEDFEEYSRIICQLPSVTQKSGHWIETEYHRWRCSVCREKGMSEWDNIHNVRTNFCPDCGAKMESEDKE